MAKCSCCGKGVTFGIKVSPLSSSEQPYLEPQCQAREGDREVPPKYIYACTRCLRSGKVTRAV